MAENNFDWEKLLTALENVEATKEEKKLNAYKDKIEAVINELECKLAELQSLKNAIVSTIELKVKNTELKLAVYKSGLEMCNKE